MCHVTAPDVWGEHARTHLDLLFAPCCKWLVHHISNGKNLFFKFIFKIWYIITSPVIGRAQLLLIVTKKKKKKPHPTSWCGFLLLIDSFRIAPAIQPRVRQPGRALDWKRIAYETLFMVHFILKCGTPVVYSQIAYCENHLDIIERHSIQWLPYYIQRDFQRGKIVTTHQYSHILK